MAVNPVTPPGLITSTGAGATRPDQAGGGSLPFADMVKDLIQDTSRQQGVVDQSLEQLVSGEADSIHDVVLAASRADLAFRLVVEIRNRLISSYQEIMRMQV